MVGFNYNGTDYYYRKNLQGDSLAIVNASGSVVAQYDYDAWGTVLSVTGILASTIGAINPFRYRGYYYDTETKLYYLNSRYYDPEVGRFINANDVQYLGENGDFVNYNLFAYCANNPVKTVDENGKFWHIVIGAVIGAVVNVAINATVAAIKGEEYSLEDGIKDAAVGALSGGLAASGVGLLGQVVGNACISMADDATTQIIENEGFDNFNVGSIFLSGLIGGTIGLIGGKGASFGNAKTAHTLGKQLTKRVFIKHEIKKGFRYYAKNMMNGYGKSIYAELGKAFGKTTPVNFLYSIFS